MRKFLSLSIAFLVRKLKIISPLSSGIRWLRQEPVLERLIVLGVALIFVLTSPPMSPSDLGWNVQAQASAHATVLGLFATVTAVFLYMTLQWSMTERTRQVQSSDTLRMYYEGAGWAALLFALFSFGIAAFSCAMLAGLANTPDSYTLRPFAAMINIYALYLWGIFLAAMGGMYTARLFGFGVADFVPNRVVLQLIGVIGLVILHANASPVFFMTRVPYYDWILYVCLVILVILDPLWTRIIKVNTYLESGLRLRRLVIWTCLAATALPLYICGANFRFIRPSWLRGSTNNEGVSKWMIVELIGLYFLISLSTSVLVNIYRKTSATTSSTSSVQLHKTDSVT